MALRNSHVGNKALIVPNITKWQRLLDIYAVSSTINGEHTLVHSSLKAKSYIYLLHKTKQLKRES